MPHVLWTYLRALRIVLQCWTFVENSESIGSNDLNGRLIKMNGEYISTLIIGDPGNRYLTFRQPEKIADS